jgi:hypothetical protein
LRSETHKYDINVVCELGFTALHKQAEIGFTALHKQAKIGDKHKVKLLIEAGASKD